MEREKNIYYVKMKDKSMCMWSRRSVSEEEIKKIAV
jgi:hypothetical protein